MAWYANSSGQTQYGPTGGPVPAGYTLITTWNGNATSPPPPQAIQIAQQVAAQAPAAQAAAQAAAAPGPNLAAPYATTTLGYGANPSGSPSITGQGLFQSSPYAINDTAITGAPTQGAAQDYGLNDVWGNLSNALGSNAVGANGQTATAAGQTQLANTLATQAAGGGVSPADLQLQAGEQATLANQMSLLGSQRGGGSGNPALAARLAQEGAAAGGANLNQQMGIQRAQETLGAQNALGSVLGTQMSGEQAGQQLYNQQQLAALGAMTGVGQSQQAAALANQQLQVQQQNAVNQVNEAGYGNAAQANANLLGGIASAGGAGLGLLANLAKGAGGGGTSGSGFSQPTVSNGVESSTDATPSGSAAASADYNQPSGFDDSGDLSDENLKEGVQGGNPMLESFLSQYKESTAPTESVNVTSNYVAPRRISNPTTTAVGGPSQETQAGEQALGAIPLVGGVASFTMQAAQPWATESTTPGYTAPASGFQQIGVTPEQTNLGGTTSDEDAKTEIRDADEGDVWSKIASLSPAEVKTDIQPGNSAASSYLGQVAGSGAASATTPPPYYGGGVQPGGAPAATTPQGQQSAGPIASPFLGAMQAAQATPAAAPAPSAPIPTSAPSSGPIPGKLTTAAAGGRTPGPAVDTFATGQGQQQGWQFGGGPTVSQLPSAYTQATGDITATMPGSAALGNTLGLANQFKGATLIPPVPTAALPPTAALGNTQSLASTFAGASPVPTSALGVAGQPTAQPTTPFKTLGTLGVTTSDEDEKKNVTDPKEDDVQGFLDSVHAHSYRYKNPNELGAGHGTFVSPMAQEIEKTDLGKNFVFQGPQGHKMVDYGKMAGTLLASQAMLNERLDEHDRILGVN